MNKSDGKIGIGIVTTNRPGMFAKCVQSMPQCDEVVVIENGTAYPEDVYAGRECTIIRNKTAQPVGHCKNQLLRHFMVSEFDHIFLAEDDIEILNPDVCKIYIETAAVSGIWHLNYGLSGPANKKDGMPNPKQMISYGSRSVALYHHCVGSWSYYYKGLIKIVGYMDERYKNALEHVDHTYKITLENLHPPFWWFADVGNSNELIADQDQDLQNSCIRKSPGWQANFNSSAGWFMQKHGYPFQAIPDLPPDHVANVLNHLKKSYSADAAAGQ